jgi:DNA polymerase-1
MHLLVDGRHFVYRAFYSMPDLTRGGDNFPVGAIHGWCRIIGNLIDEYPQATMEVFWDAGHKARAELHEEYKANRKPTPEPMKLQLPFVERITSLMGITNYKEEGMEADDLIASRAWSLSDAGAEVLIVSADKDFAHCVNEKINMLIPPPTANAKEGWRRLGNEGVKEKWGVMPEQMADLLALMGDNSDNIKGLEGVGPKTAAEWLRTYKDIEGIIGNCGRLSPKSKQNLVYESQELLKRNRELVTLKRRELPGNIATKSERNVEELLKVLEELHLRACTEEMRKRFAKILQR